MMNGAPQIWGSPAQPFQGQGGQQQRPMPTSPPGMTPPSTYQMPGQPPQPSMQPPQQHFGGPMQSPQPPQLPQQPQPGQQTGQMNPQIQQLMQNPQFMQMLMQHLQQMRGGQGQNQGLGGLSAMQPQLGGGTL